MNQVVPDQVDRRRMTQAPAVFGQPPIRLRSVRQTMWLLVQGDAVLTDDEREYRDVICALSPAITAGYGLAQRFLRLVRERDATAFDAWLVDAAASDIPAFANFARSLRQDEDGVRNALHESWSNGPVEGHVHRLKMIKRTMYDSVGELRTGCEYLRERRRVGLSHDPRHQMINNPNDIACRSGAEMLEMRFLQSNGTR